MRYPVSTANSRKRATRRGKQNKNKLVVGAMVAGLCVLAGAGSANAAGGTAKPPGGAKTPPAAGACPTGSPATSACVVPAAGPVLPNFPAVGAALSGNASNGFSIIGFTQNVTTVTPCGNAGTAGTVLGNQAAIPRIQTTTGGTVTVNGIVITIPNDTIVQYPANTLTWADAVCGANPVSPPIALNGTGGTGARVYPGVEISVDGNIVAAAGGVAGPGSPHVAALIHISQQSVNTGSGYISFIDYTDGSIYVSSPSAPGPGREVRLLINDPRGRYGRVQTSVDARFSVDDANPTIKAARSGYPMCVPRTAPPAAGANETDPLCPQKNRPTAGCRNFALAGVTFRVGADLATVPINGFCSGFVMKALAGMPGTFNLAGSQIANGNGIVRLASNTDPDPRQMAPFEVGDFITWQGTLVVGGNVNAPASSRATTTGAAGAGDVIWVHTIDANVGIYTQPATLPAYIAIGANGIGVNPLPITAVAVAGVEATPRINLEANTTDVASIVDIYLDDKGFSLATPAAGAAAGCATPCIVPDSSLVPVPLPGAANEYFRWITPETMTGALADQALQIGKGVVFPRSLIAQANAFGGGIETQFVGPQPGRARIRAIKVPAVDATLPCIPGATVGGTQGCAITQSPTRYIRAVLRTLCAPDATGNPSTPGVAALATVPKTNLTETAAVAPAVTLANTGSYYDINGNRANTPTAGVQSLVIGGTPVFVNFQGGGLGAAGALGNPSFVGAGDGTCLQSAQYANGLFTGQYMAPVSEYIFPENTLAGFAVLPANFWHMGFLAYGENGRDGNATAPQTVPARPW